MRQMIADARREPAAGSGRSVGRFEREAKDETDMAKHLDTPPPPSSPKRPEDQTTPPYTPGGVTPPDGEVPKSDTERTVPPRTYPPKQNP